MSNWPGFLESEKSREDHIDSPFLDQFVQISDENELNVYLESVENPFLELLDAPLTDGTADQEILKSWTILQTELEEDIFEYENPGSDKLFEQETPAKCPKFPRRFTLDSWKKRWRMLRRSRRAQFFNRLRKKKIKLARLAHGRIRVPTERITWILGRFSENLTISLDDLTTEIPEVNVTVELMRDLWGVSRSDIDLAVDQHVWNRHGTVLSGCPIWVGTWGNIEEATFGKGFIEEKLGISLDRMISVTHVNSLPPAEKLMTLLVTYVSFPPEINRFVKYKADITDNKPRSFPEIAADLKATRLASLKVDLPSKNTLWLLKRMKRIDAPSWVRRLTFDLKNLPHIAPRAEVRIDLFKFDIQDLKALDFQFHPTSHMKDYIVKRIQQPNRPWVNQFFRMTYQSSLETNFQINLQPLASHATTDQDRTFFLVTIIFPVNRSLLKSIVPDDVIHLDNFPFGKSTPTNKHRNKIKLVARHIADSWIRSVAWQNFRPITRIILTGFTDSVGSLGFNRRLSEQRARVVEALLKRSIEKHWESSNGEGSSLIRRLEFEIRPAGKVPAISDVGDNTRAGGWRGVEIKLDYAQSAKEQLKDILLEAKDLMEDRALVDEVFVDPDFADVAKCVLNKLINVADVDDRFVRVGAVAYDPADGKLMSLHLDHIRTILLRKFFGKETSMSKRQKLRAFRAVLLLIKKGSRELEKHMRGAATDDTIKTLMEYTKFHLRNPKHIYNCFEGRR